MKQELVIFDLGGTLVDLGRNKLEPQVRDLLEALSNYCHLAIATNEFGPVHDILSHTDIEHFFHAVVTPHDVPRGHVKPHPMQLDMIIQQLGYADKKHLVTFIGDSHTDHMTAKNAGVRFIGYGNLGENNVSRGKMGDVLRLLGPI